MTIRYYKGWGYEEANHPIKFKGKSEVIVIGPVYQYKTETGMYWHNLHDVSFPRDTKYPCDSYIYPIVEWPDRKKPGPRDPVAILVFQRKINDTGIIPFEEIK